MALHPRRTAARAALLVLLLAPASATRGQTLDTSESADLDRIINIAECRGETPDALVLVWSATAFSQVGSYTVLASDTVGCPFSPVTSARTAILGTTVGTGAQGVFPPSGSPPLPVPRVLEALGITCSSRLASVFFCVDLSDPGPTTRVGQDALPLDLLAPPEPVAIAAAPQPEALLVSWTTGTSPTLAALATGYRLTATASADPRDVHTLEVMGGASSNASLPGLRGGATYDVFVVALSMGGNPSPASNVIQGTPAPAAPRGDGGAGASPGNATPGSGGCAAGQAGLATLLAALAAAALRAGTRTRA